MQRKKTKGPACETVRSRKGAFKHIVPTREGVAMEHIGTDGLTVRTKNILYCYLDEAGDFNFSPTGSAFYLYTALVTRDPFPLCEGLLRAKYTLVMSGRPFSKSHRNNDYFHASEDSPETRELGFATLAKHLGSVAIYTVVIQKNKVDPEMRDQRAFFTAVIKRLIEEVLAAELDEDTEHVCLISDRIPVQKKSSAIVGSVKKSLRTRLEEGVGFSFVQMDSKSDFGLQAADYCSWAIYRTWTTGECTYRNLIEGAVASETDLLADRKTVYYR